MNRITLNSIILLLCTTISFAQTATKKTMEKERIVAITTDYGTMKVKLYNETPQHRDNFIKLANEGFYDSLLFHRIIKSFMIQGGDPKSKNAPASAQLGSGDVGYTVPAEFNPALFHKKGALCAARTENPAKASSGCQFYIAQGKVYTSQELDQMGKTFTPEQRKAYTTVGGVPFLDMGYTVYGEVTEGLDVLDKIAAVQTAPGDRPVKNVMMKVKVVQ
jgi:peptidyl-prolyl cis-trans isomerase B (cyclophilin B)